MQGGKNEETQRVAVSTFKQPSVSSFLSPKMADGDDPAQIKFECKELDPCENSWAVHISPHNSGIVIGKCKSSINANSCLLYTSDAADE